MAAADRREAPGLTGQLFREPHRFDLLQAVRLLERVLRPSARAGPAPDRDVVRYRALAALSFPAGAVSHIVLPNGTPGNGASALPELVVACLGLTGPQGVLPHHYTALLLERIRARDFSLRDFLDLFNHRLVALFVRAWQKYRLTFAFERARLDPQGGEDLATRALFALVGLGTAGLRGRLRVDDQALLYYSGHFAHQPRNALALEQLLADYFAVPLSVQQLQGQWLYLRPGDQTALPSAEEPLGRNNQLGLGVVVGERVWDVQSKFRLRVGPLTYAQFRRLMPNGDGLRPLCEMTRLFAGPELDFEVQAVLKPQEVPRCRLRTAGSERPHLGWNTWASSRKRTREADEAVFSLQSL
jgi:type VI secretion system protein ImpH